MWMQMRFSKTLHWDWYYLDLYFFMAEKDKQHLTSYELTIWISVLSSLNHARHLMAYTVNN